MVFLGAYFGYRKPVEPYPVVTSNIPRQVRETIVFFFWHEQKTRNAVGGPRNLYGMLFARVLVSLVCFGTKNRFSTKSVMQRVRVNRRF